MEQQINIESSKEKLMTSFEQLLQKYKTESVQFEDKQKILQQQEDKKILEAIAKYTVESIVKRLADVQLEFRDNTQILSDKILSEVNKLSELKQAITILNNHLEKHHNILIVAGALNLLRQENEQKIKALEEESTSHLNRLELEIKEEKLKWQNEEDELKKTTKIRQELLKKERERAEAEFKYTLERKRKIENDEYESKKKVLEQKLLEEFEIRDENWQLREKKIAEQQEELKSLKTKVDSFSGILEKETSAAKQETIKEIQEQAEIDATLREKGYETEKQSYALKIKALEQIILKQTDQIKSMSAELQVALKQVQELATKTVEGSKSTSRVIDSKGAK